MTEYNFQTFKEMNFWCNSYRISLSISAYETLQCMSHKICPCISNKCLTVTDFDFVFDNKTLREHLKKY